MAKDQKPTTLVIPQLVQIARVDPEWKSQQKELQYDFRPKGRAFYADPNRSGNYGHSFDSGFGPGFDSRFSNRGGKA